MMNLENTKVYTTDEEVIKKFTEICGKEFAGFNHDRVGVFNGNHYVKGFSLLSCVDIESKYKVLIVEEINALYDEKFGIKTETTEEKESLDNISTKESVDWDEEGLPPVGVECWFNWINSTPELCTPTYFGNGVGCYIDKRGNEYTMALNTLSFSKLETPQQREERERLEAAYDLYCDWCVANWYPKFSFEQFKATKKDLAGMLAIVDKTGYRLESK